VSSIPKPGEQHFGVAVGNVVFVLVRVEEQVRRLGDVHAAVAEAEAAGDVQSADEVLALAVDAVLVRVVADGESIRALGSVRRGLGNLVPDGPEVLVLLEGLEPGVVGVLEILQHPHPPPVVEADAHRLADHRLGCHGPNGEPLGQFHPLGGLFGGEPLGCPHCGKENGGEEGDESRPAGHR
jgi:hypothetical protein